MVDGFSKTPHYVLRDGSHPRTPAISHTSSEDPLMVIFGFSDKPEYDAFLASTTLALTPYPLVKCYLQNQIAMDVASLHLIVLYATSFQQPILHAATFQSVLESFQNDKDSVAVSHQLELQGSPLAYRVQAFSIDTVA